MREGTEKALQRPLAVEALLAGSPYSGSSRLRRDNAYRRFGLAVVLNAKEAAEGFTCLRGSLAPSLKTSTGCFLNVRSPSGPTKNPSESLGFFVFVEMSSE